MFYIKDPQQTNSLDPWEHLGPKRRKLLENSWASLFREEILPILPVEILEEYYSKNEGRPTKELYSLLGMMVLQESFNLSDELL